MKRSLAVCLALFWIAGCRFPGIYSPRDGDIIFQCPVEQNGDFVYTAVGIIMEYPHGYVVVDTASQLEPRPLFHWMTCCRFRPIIVKRLRDRDALVDVGIRIREQVASWESRPYDRKRSWSDDELYGAEMVWKLYDRALGIELCPLADVAENGKQDGGMTGAPAGKSVTIADIFRSPLLVEVHRE